MFLLVDLNDQQNPLRENDPCASRFVETVTAGLRMRS
jgi:hypothetical protein